MNKNIKDCFFKMQMYISLFLFFWFSGSQFIKFLTVWKPIFGIPEYLMFFSYLLSLLYYFYRILNGEKTSLIFHFMIILSLLSLLLIDRNELIPSFSIFLNVYGTFSLGIGFIFFLREIFSTQKYSYKVNLFLIVGVIISFGIILESISKIINPNWYNFIFINNSNEHWNRLGVKRSQFFFPSPMVAGQFLWFVGSFLIFYASSLANNSKIKIWLYEVGIFNYASTIFTLSRGPITLVVLSLTLFLFFLFKGRAKEFKFVLLSSIITIILTIFIFYIKFNLDIENFLRNYFSLNEGANSGRYFLIKNGLHELIYNFNINGHGIYLLSPFHSFTGIQFENTYLTLIFGFGVIGLFLSFIIISSFIFFTFHNFGSNQTSLIKYIIIISFPWFIYSFVYPVFRESYTAFLSNIIFVSIIIFSTNIKILEKDS